MAILYLVFLLCLLESPYAGRKKRGGNVGLGCASGCLDGVPWKKSRDTPGQRKGSQAYEKDEGSRSEEVGPLLGSSSDEGERNVQGPAAPGSARGDEEDQGLEWNQEQDGQSPTGPSPIPAGIQGESSSTLSPVSQYGRREASSQDSTPFSLGTEKDAKSFPFRAGELSAASSSLPLISRDNEDSKSSSAASGSSKAPSPSSVFSQGMRRDSPEHSGSSERFDNGEAGTFSAGCWSSAPSSGSASSVKENDCQPRRNVGIKMAGQIAEDHGLKLDHESGLKGKGYFTAHQFNFGKTLKKEETASLPVLPSYSLKRSAPPSESITLGPEPPKRTVEEIVEEFDMVSDGYVAFEGGRVPDFLREGWMVANEDGSMVDQSEGGGASASEYFGPKKIDSQDFPVATRKPLKLRGVLMVNGPLYEVDENGIAVVSERNQDIYRQVCLDVLKEEGVWLGRLPDQPCLDIVKEKGIWLGPRPDPYAFLIVESSEESLAAAHVMKQKEDREAERKRQALMICLGPQPLPEFTKQSNTPGWLELERPEPVPLESEEYGKRWCTLVDLESAGKEFFLVGLHDLTVPHEQRIEFPPPEPVGFDGREGGLNLKDLMDEDFLGEHPADQRPVVEQEVRFSLEEVTEEEHVVWSEVQDVEGLDAGLDAGLDSSSSIPPSSSVSSDSISTSSFSSAPEVPPKANVSLALPQVEEDRPKGKGKRRGRARTSGRLLRSIGEMGDGAEDGFSAFKVTEGADSKIETHGSGLLRGFRWMNICRNRKD